MGKCFIIASIDDVSGEGRKATIYPDGEENGRVRILHLDPVREVEASGVEMDSSDNPNNNTAPYLLRGYKPLSEWQSGDMVYEEIYPEIFDK